MQWSPAGMELMRLELCPSAPWCVPSSSAPWCVPTHSLSDSGLASFLTSPKQNFCSEKCPWLFVHKNTKERIHEILQDIQIVFWLHGWVLQQEIQLTCTSFTAENAPNHHISWMFDPLDSVVGVKSAATFWTHLLLTLIPFSTVEGTRTCHCGQKPSSLPSFLKH